MRMPFKEGNILIPENTDMSKWSVVACDQYTSEPEYWEEVEKLVGDSPSTLNITLPEIYLEDKNVSSRIKDINANMEKLLKKKFFKEYKNSMIYIERKQSDGRVREGLIGVVDLEEYSYEEGSTTPIRATEKTVLERIPSRVKIRENASLELPHIMLLIDDDKKEIIEQLKKTVRKDDIIYDFDLMENGGSIKGYLLDKQTIKDIKNKLKVLGNKKNFEGKYKVKNKGILLFATGDGNHSLASAKTCYENLKKTMSEEEYLKHPARYALVEIVNLHSDALEFEAIHRVVFDVDSEELVEEMKKYYKMNKNGNGQKVEIVTSKKDEVYYIEDPKSNIAVGSVQIFLDDYLKKHKGKIDYIHEEETTKNLAKKGNIGFIFEPMKKNELFKTVILDGSLPRKTFSMGHSYDKRYYLEARKIKKD